MIGLYISLGVLLFLLALFLLFSYYAYRKTFFASDEKKLRDPYKGIDKRGYKPYEATMRSLIDNIISPLKYSATDTEAHRSGILQSAVSNAISAAIICCLSTTARTEKARETL